MQDKMILQMYTREMILQLKQIFSRKNSSGLGNNTDFL